MENQSIFSSIMKSMKDSFVWIMGGEPYKEKVIFDLNPENDVTAVNESKINWTRIIIFLIGFGYLFTLIFPLIKNLRK